LETALPFIGTLRTAAGIMRLFPLLIATMEQVGAYARYFAEKHNPAAAFLCIVFLIFGPALAIAIDLAFLPARIDAMLRGHSHRRRDTPFLHKPQRPRARAATGALTDSARSNHR